MYRQNLVAGKKCTFVKNICLCPLVEFGEESGVIVYNSQIHTYLTNPAH